MDLFDLKTFDKALEGALSFLGRITPAGAHTRLHNIDVEEVSFVDRAANKRQFLIVKREDAMNKIKLTATGRDNLLEKLTKALEDLVVVSDAVKDAEIVEEETPNEELAEKLASVNVIIKEVLGADEDPEPAPPVEEDPEPVAQAAETDPPQEDPAPPAEEDPEPVAQAAQADPPPAADETPQENEPISEPVTQADPAHVDLDAMSDDEFFTAFEAAEAEIGGLGSEFSDKMRVLAQVIARIADAPDPVSLNNIRREMIGAMKAAGAMVKAVPVEEGGEVPTAGDVADMFRELAKKVEGAEKRNVEPQVPLPNREPGDMGNVGQGPEEDGPAKDKQDGELGNILKSIKTLNEKVEKLSQVPQAPASRHEDPNKNNNTTHQRKRPTGGKWVL
jgi:hypothetical protein